ncbi:spore cortex biosynthesis protein YabQ [Paenibacillus cellulosilyticus]|uniref:Spore cortex biosynthesis protein YabQ n=1 Tax=Paenibacillus cellulosilyticus TaxID=375489 RepID=A0A2V2YN43_9BACL|nr:spore cortex biosynthesis protein YabQ [Paenibacillus cellulosilyticus]PWV95998.1 spore cortex biosynthesis protein YabQ [Paenibacillus cellulosilyticus]QKS48462.1 spore cortex biosynthesis protein YabQ [Paenibacillus cellulosilyticus]
MNLSLSEQWLTMSLMLLSGIGMGIVFDGYRVVSHELRFAKWTLPVFDLLYWAAATLVVFQVLSAGNNGEVRAYVFLGLALGVIVYFLLLSRAVIATVRWTIGAVRYLIGLFIKLFHIFIIRPLLILYKLCKVLLGFLLALTIFCYKIVLQLIRPFWLLTRWIIKPLLRPLMNWLTPIVARWRIGEKTANAVNKTAAWWKRTFGRKT